MSPRVCLVCGSTEPRTPEGRWIHAWTPRIEWFCSYPCAETFDAWSLTRQADAICERGDILARLTHKPLVRVIAAMRRIRP